MFLTSPAVTELKALMFTLGDCWEGTWSSRSGCKLIGCETGITMGELADAFKEQTACHQDLRQVISFVVRIT